MTDAPYAPIPQATALTKSNVYDISLVDHWADITKNVDMETHRVALCLSSTMGERYFVAEILEEWPNAVRILPEGDGAWPLLVFKNCIEAIRIMSRPHKRRNERE